MTQTLGLAIAVLLVWSVSVRGQGFGRFVGDVIAKWDEPGRTMTLVEDFAYVGPDGLTWHAPKGSQVDGASIPRIAWTVVGGPFEGLYRKASVIHDVACATKARSWRAVHRAFYTAMLAAGVGDTRAKIMYAAVYHFGPRWPEHRVENRCVVEPGRTLPTCEPTSVLAPPPSPSVRESQFNEMAMEIQNRDQMATESRSRVREWEERESRRPGKRPDSEAFEPQPTLIRPVTLDDIEAYGTVMLTKDPD
jgi:hypothetical protein